MEGKAQGNKGRKRTQHYLKNFELQAILANLQHVWTHDKRKCCVNHMINIFQKSFSDHLPHDVKLHWFAGEWEGQLPLRPWGWLKHFLWKFYIFIRNFYIKFSLDRHITRLSSVSTSIDKVYFVANHFLENTKLVSRNMKNRLSKSIRILLCKRK